MRSTASQQNCSDVPSSQMTGWKAIALRFADPDEVR